MARRPLGATLVVIALLGAACGGDRSTTVDENASAEPPRPGVSALSYSPKPFFQEQTEMTVRFTTTGPAGAGREYKVYLDTGRDYNGSGCYPEWESSEPIKGGIGKTYVVPLDSEAVFDEDTFFCPGRALLLVRTQNVNGYDGRQPRLMRKLSFRIHPPRR